MKVIHLTKNKISLVDDEDFERVNQYKWHANEKGADKFYAYRKQWIPSTTRTSKKGGLIYNGYYKTIPMHRFIMNPTDKMEIDHRDGNGLNNQKFNLRLCSHEQNTWNTKIRKNNTSGFKGIYWEERTHKWRTVIQYKKKTIHLGRFKELEDAIRVRKIKEAELFKDFQHLQ